MLDKGRKKFRALSMIRENPTPYVMLADADDLIHCNLVKTIENDPSESGWFLRTGYFYYESGWPYLVRSTNFDIRCGTSIIARVQAHELPTVEDEWVERPFELEEHFLMKPHNEIRDFLSSQGVELKSFPFAAVIGVRGTSENAVNTSTPKHSYRSYLGMLRRSRPISAKIRRDFHLVDLNYRQTQHP